VGYADRGQHGRRQFLPQGVCMAYRPAPSERSLCLPIRASKR